MTADANPTRPADEMIRRPDEAQVKRHAKGNAMTRIDSSGTHRNPGWVTGFAFFAGWMMILLGVFHAAMGFTAILNDQFFGAVRNYTYAFDVTGWGWVHLTIGIVVFLAGFAVFDGRPWARGLGIGLAAISAIANFLWLPYEPVWAIILIALDITVIWALSKYELPT